MSYLDPTLKPSNRSRRRDTVARSVPSKRHVPAWSNLCSRRHSPPVHDAYDTRRVRLISPPTVESEGALGQGARHDPVTMIGQEHQYRWIALLALSAFFSGLIAPGRVAAQEPRIALPAVDSTATEPPISARGALLRSFAIPGWGQSYAGAPGRGAVYFAMEAGSLWMVYKTSRQLATARARDRYLRETGRLQSGEISGTTRSRAQQFEDWTTLAVAVLLFSGADAYVTAQLADFDDQIDVSPGEEGGLQIRAHLPIGGRR